MRGFALTVHCPRCGTAKPMGAEVTPIVTCVKCGLGFDPKPREQPPREPTAEPEPEPTVALERAVPGRLKIEPSGNAVHITIRESVVHGVFLLLIAFFIVLVGFMALATHRWAVLVAAVGFAPAAAYAGVSRLIGRTYIDVTRDVISASQDPLPRFDARVFHGDVVTFALEIHSDVTGQSINIVAEQAGKRRILVNVTDRETANEIVATIRKHRARLGTPIRDEIDQAATRVDKRDT